MMKVVRIRHWRCGEISGSTWLWAPDDITEERLQADVGAAMKDYDAAKGSVGEQLHYPANFDEFDQNLSLAEAKRMLEEQRKAYFAWRDRQAEVAHCFGYWMTKRGYVPLYEREDLYPEADACWGHRHGEQIDMSVTETDCRPSDENGEDDDPYGF